MADRVRHGTSNKGDSNGMSKLTERDIKEIRNRLAGGDLQRVVAADFGVVQGTISSIGLGKSWGWMK